MSDSCFQQRCGPSGSVTRESHGSCGNHCLVSQWLITVTDRHHDWGLPTVLETDRIQSRSDRPEVAKAWWGVGLEGTNHDLRY